VDGDKEKGDRNDPGGDRSDLDEGIGIVLREGGREGRREGGREEGKEAVWGGGEGCLL
jgi:hypothetical protein